MTGPIQISENCWKHKKENGDVFYHKTSDPGSDLHREDGPAIEWANGDKYWYFNGKRHKLDGPAIEQANGDKYWYFNGKRHKLDGPAIEYVNGNTLWFYKGTYIPFKNNLKLIKK